MTEPRAPATDEAAAADPAIQLAFHRGTIEIRGLGPTPSVAADPLKLPPGVSWDERSACHRAPASAYPDVVRTLVRGKVPYTDDARRYGELDSGAKVRRDPRPYQTEALDAWRRARCAGTVVLPTGAGKSHVAVMAIDDRRRDTLVVAPTLDLVRQWYDLLRATFGGQGGVEVGVVGGGDFDVCPITITTYDSAHLHMEHLGARFGLLVFDECHHLPGETYSFSALASLAPFRLGLTATPERSDGREDALISLIGPEVYRKDIIEMSGDYLADYETEHLSIDLTPDERARYDEARRIYRDFVVSQGIRMSQPGGWTEFIQRSAWSDAGREAMRAYREQRDLAFAASGKMETVAHLLHRHRDDRALLFTQNNAAAYAISRRFLIPAITHQTKVTERSAILDALKAGRIRAVVTSKVLNEGVDVPDANVAIIVSGSGSVREHVQRLGRVLRKVGDKRAVLYELVTAGTSETFTSERRRAHNAYG